MKIIWISVQQNYPNKLFLGGQAVKGSWSRRGLVLSNAPVVFSCLSVSRRVAPEGNMAISLRRLWIIQACLLHVSLTGLFCIKFVRLHTINTFKPWAGPVVPSQLPGEASGSTWDENTATSRKLRPTRWTWRDSRWTWYWTWKQRTLVDHMVSWYNI